MIARVSDLEKALVLAFLTIILVFALMMYLGSGAQ